VKQKLDDNDDEPTYVVEGSHEVVSKEEYERLVNDETDQQPAGNTAADSKTETQPSDKTGPVIEGKSNGQKAQQSVAGIGGGKKRKQVKVVSDEKPDEKEQKTQKPQSSAKKSKQKKRVKLSFEED
jgi:hypothetical protein